MPLRFFRFFRHLSWPTLKKVFQLAGERRLTGLAAEMAYNAMLALFPAILALFTAIGLFKSSKYTFLYLARQLSNVAPTDALSLIQGFAQEIAYSQNQGLFSISFFGAIWVASGAVSAAMNALDQIHQIPREQVRPFWKAKLVSLSLTVGTIFLLITASFLVFLSHLIVREAVHESGLIIFFRLWHFFMWPLALGIVAAAFGFIYRYGPSRWVAGTPIMPGAILAAVSWAILSALFRLYASNFGHFNIAYGAVGTFIVLMLWLYLTSLVLLIGDQVNVTVGEAMRQKCKGAALEPSEVPESEG